MKAQPKASHFIGGAFVEDKAGKPLPVIYPATGEEIAKLYSATPGVIEAAYAAALKAQGEWAALKPSSADAYCAARRKSCVRRTRNCRSSRRLIPARRFRKRWWRMPLQPPMRWSFSAVSFPVSTASSWNWAARLPIRAAKRSASASASARGTIPSRSPRGNPRLRSQWAMPSSSPSENTPLSALALAEAYKEAGLPDGLFNVVQGFGDVGAALVNHRLTAKVSLTGSVPTGKRIMAQAGEHLKHVTMELGGKSPIIVFDDADLESAIGGAMLGNFYSTGQVCSNGTRVFVHKDVRERFVDRLVERTRKIRIGDPLDEATQMGPLVNAAQREKVLSYIEKGKAEGATLAYGGGIPKLQGFDKGYFIEPTIFTDVTDDMTIAREEIFGPVMSVLEFIHEDEVIARANDSEFGLAAGVFTADIARGHRVIGQIKAGTCWINAYNLTPVEVPFGGYKQSGIGRENGIAALAHYSQIKTVYVEMGKVDSPY